MADKKISQLPISTTLDGTELVPIVQGGVTVQATSQDIANLNTPTLQDLQSVTDEGRTTTNSITANAFIKTGGTSTQFLKANGTVDNSVYITSADIPNFSNLIKQRVRAGEDLIKGQVVYASGSNGTDILVQKADNRNDPTAGKVLGIIAEDLPINNVGFVITEGTFDGVDTSSATEGDAVWLGINGNYIFGLINKPNAPDALVFIGIVRVSDSVNGSIFVKIQNGLKLSENNEVDLITTTPSNNEILTYELSTGLWKNKTVVSALGFTPYNSTNPSGYITSSALSSYVPYTGATANVDLGSNSLTASDLIINHSSGSGVAVSITKGGSGEALTVVKSSGSGNVASFTGGNTFISTLTTPTINGVSGLLSFGSNDRVSVGNYATPSSQRIFTVGQDTAYTSIGSMIGATGSSAIYMNVATPSAVNYVLRSSGSNLFLNTPSASDSLILSTGGVANRFVITGTFGGASFNAFALLGASNTGQTASTAVSGWNYQSFSRQWNTGFIATQSENVWGATTYSFVGASTITNAYGNVFNAPIAGTNATITNNWAAQFNGNVVIGSTGQLIEIKQTANAPTYTQTGATSSVFTLKSGTRSFAFTSYASDQNYLITYGGNFRIMTGDALPIEFYTTNTKRLTILSGGSLLFAEANDIQTGTTTGTKIATGTTQKLSFWNATPIVQPANTTSLNGVLENTGLMASGSTISTINKPLVVGANTTPRTGVATDGVTSVLGNLQNFTTNYHSGEVLYSEVSGEALNFGQLCYRNAAGKWQKATGSSSTIAAYNMLGICLQTVGATDTAISILTRGYVETTYLSSGAVGNPLFIDATTAGSITNTAPSTSGNIIRLIGNVFWSSATQTNSKWILYFNPDNTWIEL